MGAQAQIVRPSNRGTVAANTALAPAANPSREKLSETKVSLQRIRTKDHAGALLLIALGAGVALWGRTYRVGSLTEMGAGYIPFVIGVLLIAVGILVGITAKAPPAIIPNLPGPKKAQRGIDARGAFCIVGSIASFVILGTYGGMVPASFACVFIAAIGDRSNSLRDALLLAGVLTLAGFLIFSWALKLSLAPFSWG
jgi:hypothetical protein